MQMIIVITMYNEPYSQVLESLIGLYRSYLEIIYSNIEYEGRVSIQIVCDGYDKLDPQFLPKCAKAGIYDQSKLEHRFLYEKKAEKEGETDMWLP